MSVALSEEIRNLIDGANFAHLSTLMPDGSPQSVPVWIGREGDRVVICSGENSLKARNTKRDPRVSLSMSISKILIKKPNSAAALSSVVLTGI
jgi:nitroimidazol reductase NimA-like FMN-containing flavoprotein (pyridoxamine 5'-phosphate oxidase superfamily)